MTYLLLNRARGISISTGGRLLMCRHAGNESSKNILETKKCLEEISSASNEVHTSPLISDFIKSLTHTIIPTSSGNAALQDNSIKTQILLSCERTFNRAIPDNQLGSIVTVDDIIKYYESTQPSSNPHSLFPHVDRIRSESQLPPNLSFPEVTNKPSSTPNRARVPFQNYDSVKHASFLTKQEKEARKRKRRHLTVWK